MRTIDSEAAAAALRRHHLLDFILVFAVIVCHLQTSSPEATLDIEAFIGFAAVENALVAAHLLGDVIEGLNQPQTELLTLLVLGHGNVFDVSDGAEAVNAATKGRERDTLAQMVLYTTRAGRLEGGKTYNLCSTIMAPVATTELRSSGLAVSSMTTV